MGGLSALQLLLILWGAITAVFLAFVGYRSLVGMKEEDTLFLSPAEANMEAEQRQLQMRLGRITPYTRAFGYASAGLLAVIAGIWIYGAMREFFSS